MKKALLHVAALAIHIPTVRQTGTFQLSDLQEGGAYGDRTIAEFGVANALAVADQLTARYNATLSQSVMAFADTTTERYDIENVASGLRMRRTSEYSNVETQRGGSIEGRGFPLISNGVATGWTEHFDAIAPVSAFTTMVLAAQQANDTQIREDLAQALYDPQERPLYESLKLDSRQPLEMITGVKVKPLYNGDGEVPQPSPMGRKFDGTHNHYLSSDGLGPTAVDALTQTVGEHSVGNRLVIYINEADAADFRALPGFTANTVANVTPGANTATTNVVLDTTQTDNKHIGFTAAGIPVWTKPWALPKYAVCQNLNGPKAIKMRVPKQAILRGLRLKGQEGNTVLKAQTWESIFGFGVSNRAGAAILQFGNFSAGNTQKAYEKPALPGDQE